MLKTSALLALGVAIIFAIAGYFGFPEIARSVANANPVYIAGAIILQAATLLLLAARLVIISRPQGCIGFFTAFKVTMYGMVMNLLTPVAKIGGEPLKIYMLRRNFQTSRASAIVSLDTMTEIVASFAAVLLIFLIFIKFLPGALFAYFIVFFAVAIAALAFVFKLFTDFSWLNSFIGWFTGKISKYKKVSNIDYARAFQTTFSSLIKQKRAMAGAFSLSFAVKIAEFARMWLVFLALGTVLPLDVVLILWAVLLILSMVPWLPGGLGLVEFGGISAFIMFGVPSSIAASGMLIDRFISFWLILIAGAVLLGVRGKK